MRRIILLLLLAATSASQAQIWEKFIQPGLTYRMEIDSKVPRVIHALRWSQGAPMLMAKSQIAGPKIYDASPDRGRATLTELVNRTQAIAGLNGDFFPFTGDPLGAMVCDGELISRPWPKRAVFGWGKEASTVAMLSWKGSIQTEVSEPFSLDGLNEECPVDGLTLNTEQSGLALAKPASLYAVIKLDAGSWTTTVKREAEIVSFTTDVEAIEITPGTAVLCARGLKIADLAKLVPGTKFTVSYETTGLDWSKISNVIGGGPLLVRNGEIKVDWKESGFKDAFATKRHPRSAIGRTASGDIWLVAVDGRQTMSDGATLDELALIMQKLGCENAINLDGGGSTTISLFGLTLNRPSDGIERKISNAILLLAPIAPSEDPSMQSGLVIQGPKKIALQDTKLFTVLTAEGKPVTNAEVIWSAQGSAWIDQDGLLRPLKAGPATIMVVARGQRATLSVVVEAPPKP